MQVGSWRMCRSSPGRRHRSWVAWSYPSPGIFGKGYVASGSRSKATFEPRAAEAAEAAQGRGPGQLVRSVTSGLTPGPFSPAGNAGDLGGAVAEVLFCVPPGRVHGHAGQQVTGGSERGRLRRGSGSGPPPPTVHSSPALSGSCFTPSASTWTSSQPVSAAGLQEPLPPPAAWGNRGQSHGGSMSMGQAVGLSTNSSEAPRVPGSVLGDAVGTGAPR